MIAHDRAHLWPGVPMALAAALLFGASAPFSKMLLASIDPQMLAGLLYLGAGLGLTLVEAGRSAVGLPRPEAPLRRADVPWLAAVVACGGVVAPLLLMLGLARTSAASGSLLLNVEGLATMALAWIVYRENVDRRLLAGAAAILAGAVVLSWQGAGTHIDTGGLLIVAACLAWGLDNNFTRNLSAADPLLIALIKGSAAGIANLSLALLRGAPVPSASALAAIGALGFLAIGLSLVLYVLALRHLGSARTGAYFSLAPFIGAVIAVAFLGEPFTGRLLLAGLLMGTGLWLHLAERHDHEHLHDAMEHDHRHVHDAHHRHAHGPDDPPGEPHTHPHRHVPLRHRHAHFPDLHHRHGHG